MSKITIKPGIEISYTSRPDFWKEVEDGKWEPFTFKCIAENVEKGMTFIDIGAWNGVFSIYAAKLGAKVYALEPDPAAYREALANFVANGLVREQLQIDDIAISDQEGNAFLNSTSPSFGHSESSLINRGKIGAEVKVATMTLGDYCYMYRMDMSDVALIKIDIEGAEVMMLNQSQKFLQKHRPTIHLSIHPAWFKNYRMDMQTIADIIFPIYDVVSDHGTITTYDNFNAVVESHQHAFLLTKKVHQ